MDTSSLLTFVFITFFLVMSPGPSSLLITKTVIASGTSFGFAIVIGFLAALFIHGSLSILGVSLVLLQSPNVFFILKMLGALYLCWIGIKSLFSVWARDISMTSSLTSPPKPSITILRTFIQGFLTNMLNPKISMFYLAAFPQFLSIGDSIFRAYILVLVHVIISLFWFSTLVIIINQWKGFTINSQFSKGIKCIIGVAFIGFGAQLALSPL